MQKSTNPFLLINCFWLLVLVSCSSVSKNYTPKELDQTKIEVPYFANSKNDYVYKTNISVYGHEMSGIFIAKKINYTTHRVVFTTEFGNKLLDFEISENDFKIHSIVSELDRKILINTLKEDFRLLLKQDFKIEQAFENENFIIYKSADGNQDNYLFLTKKESKLEKIIRASHTKEKITITFTSENDSFAQKVVILHQNIKLKIELNYFKSE
ncbi:hypothetical protein [Flavobacterium agrisoli]|uniref:Lipoprotein n=1 Tax=Flavobacterium agrisoli TaxID=2793066 RepID=A0A934PJY1_9FLAO|nr:hypothetical protein [Flavobacterium agrisoli]MBK0369537.1 hypothetical protein [Flavobacterium agrisoli]